MQKFFVECFINTLPSEILLALFLESFDWPGATSALNKGGGHIFYH